MTYDDYYYYNDGYYYYDDAYYHDDTCPIEESKPMLADWFGGDKGFYHGVASGDPLPDAVIIWTRYTNDCLDDVEIEFRIAEVDPNLEFEAHLDPSKNGNIKMGRVVASKHHDWVVKLDIHGLKPYTQYVYAFTDGVTSSDVGLTKTAPCEDCEVDYVTYCTFSCSNFPNGYFHAYDLCSSIKDLDLWYVSLTCYTIAFSMWILYSHSLCFLFPRSKGSTLETTSTNTANGRLGLVTPMNAGKCSCPRPRFGR